MLDWEEDEIIAVYSYAFCVGVFCFAWKNKQKLPYKSIFVEKRAFTDIDKKRKA